MEGTTHSLGRDRLRIRLVVPFVSALVLVAAGALHTPATAATTYLTGQASGSGLPVGSGIFFSVNLTNAVSPTGKLTFRLYGPTDPSCAAAPIFVTDVKVLGNGYYASASYIANVAGTYRWTATYSGDVLNTAAGPTPCGATSAAVAVTKRVPTLSGRATQTAPSGPTSTTATLSGGGPAGPTGTLTSRLFGPGNLQCAGSPVYTASRTVAGNGAYASASYTPAAPGTYQWVIFYSGDANNHGAATTCSDPANKVTIAGGTTSGVTLTLSAATVPDGTSVTVSWAGIAQPTTADWIAFYAVGAADSNTQTWRYTTGAASGSISMTVPYGTAAGSYEFRLFANNSTVRLARAPVTVT